jgi:hypothetical protein
VLSGKKALGELQPGQCFDGYRPGESVGYVSMTACDPPHDADLIATFDWTNESVADYPEASPRAQFADPKC